MTMFIRAVLAISLLALLAACGGGGGSAGNTNGTALYSTAPDALTIAPGEVKTYTIGGGVSGYTATTTNSAASANVSGRTLTITAIGSGTSSVIVTDGAGTKITIALTLGSGVPFHTTAPDSVTLTLGSDSSIYELAGGTLVYSVTSSNTQVVQVNQNGSRFTLSGRSSGIATISATDSLGATKSISVTVASGLALYTTAPSTLTVPVGGSSAVYSIGGGSQVYSITSSDSSIATVGISNTKDFIVNGKTGGSTTVTIRDSDNKTVSVAIVVGTNDAIFTTAAPTTNMNVGVTNTFKVGGGTTTYNVASSDTSVATASISGSDLLISGVSNGTATIIIRDNVSTHTPVSLTIVVGGGVPLALFTTAPSDLIIAPFASPTFTIGGGSAPYSVSTANANIVAASVTGATLQLAGVSNGGPIAVTVKDAKGSPVTINVTVGSGAKQNLFSTAPSAVTLASGSTATYTIVGGTAPYFVTSSNTSVITVATPSSSTFSVTAVKASVAAERVVILDSLGTQLTVSVTVSPVATTVLDVLPGDSTGAVGDTLNFTISGGSPNYTISNNNPSIATVTQTAGTFTAKLLNVGSTVVSVTDAQGTLKKITITAAASSSQLRISPSLITVGEDNSNPVDLMIYGGTGPYKAFTSDLVMSSVPSTAIAQGTNGTTLTVGLGSSGSRCLVVKDSGGSPILGGTYAITITVVDSLGASATNTFNIKDNFKGGTGCN